MGSSFRANETIISWLLDWRPIPAPYQHVRNDGHMISTETSHNIYSPFLHHDIYRQHYGGLIYQLTGRHTLSQSMPGSMGNPQLVLGTQHRYQSLSYPRQIQHFSRPPIQIGQTYQNRMGFGSNSSEFHVPDAQFSECGFVCNPIQSQTPSVYVSCSGQKAFAVDALSMNWNFLHAYAFPPSILIPVVLEKIQWHQCRIVLIAPFWPQQQWFSELLQLLVSAPIRLPLIPRLLTQSKGRFVHQNLPVLDLHTWELLNNQSEIKKNSQNFADFVSRSRRTSAQKVYNAKWSIFTNWCSTKRLIRSRPLLQL